MKWWDVIVTPVRDAAGEVFRILFGLARHHHDPPQRETRSRRILLVEDHEDTRATLERLLVRRGHHVSPAGSLRAAQALAAVGEFDFVISDLGLPDGDGTELFHAFAHTVRRPIGIALTGYGMEDDIQRTLAAGFTAHLTKPIDVAELDRLLATP